MPLFHCTMVSPYQPFSGIDRAMASWHGIEGRKPDFAKTQGRKICFGVSFYLNESSEADIQPSLYNQTLSIILEASLFFQIFLFLRISHFRIFGFQFLPSRYWPEPKISEIRNSQKHKILEKLGGLKNDREGLVIQIWLNISLRALIQIKSIAKIDFLTWSFGENRFMTLHPCHDAMALSIPEKG